MQTHTHRNTHAELACSDLECGIDSDQHQGDMSEHANITSLKEHTLPLTHTHTNTQTHPYARTHTLTHAHTHALTHAHAHTHTHPYSMHISHPYHMIHR